MGNEGRKSGSLSAKLVKLIPKKEKSSTPSSPPYPPPPSGGGIERSLRGATPDLGIF
jgi:hypothetical protein